MCDSASLIVIIIVIITVSVLAVVSHGIAIARVTQFT